MLNRRGFLQNTAASLAAASLPAIAAQPAAAAPGQWSQWDAQFTPANYNPAISNPWGIHPRFLPKRVVVDGALTPGDIHVDPVACYLYHIEYGGTAMRYGVAIAKGNLYEPGVYSIRRKARWPGWTPTADMIAREPETYGPYADGMPGGPDNPLGSRALYLYEGNRDTYLRIHGTNEPRSIGGRASSGCVRMIMPHINDLYPRVRIGARAHFYSANDLLAATS